MKGRGKFITIEGIEGAGKTTCWEKLKVVFDSAKVKSAFVREPGGTALGEKIREVLLHGECRISGEAELFLYSASRAQLVKEVIKPSLDEGKWVVSDRFFDATVAYQGYGRKNDIELVKMVSKASSLGTVPDLTLILDIDPEKGLERIQGRPLDRMEKEGAEFLRRVRRGYLKIAEEEPERCVVIDAGAEKEEVFHRVLDVLRSRLGVHFE